MRRTIKKFVIFMAMVLFVGAAGSSVFAETPGNQGDNPVVEAMLDESEHTALGTVDPEITPDTTEDPAPWQNNNVVAKASGFNIMNNGTSAYVVDPSTPDASLLPGQVKMNKTAVPVPGKVNEWEVTLRVAGRPKVVTSDIVLVIDVSGSMGFYIPGMPQDRLYYTKEAAKNFVTTVLAADPVNTRISIVRFSGYSTNSNQNTSSVVQGFSNSVSTLHTAITSLSVATRTTQYTHTQSGLHRAREVFAPSTAMKKTVVLFSDGLPNRNFRLNSPTAADFLPGTQASQRLMRDDLAEGRFDYSYSVQGEGDNNSNVTIGSTTYRYYAPHATIAEGAIVRSKGLDLYAIGMYAGTEGQDTLNRTAPGKSFESDASNINEKFQEIAGALNSPVASAVVTDPMASGFIIADQGSISKTGGTHAYNAGTNTLTWNFTSLSKTTPGSDLRYEEIKYRIVITNNTPTTTGTNTLPTNGTTPMSFTDVEGSNVTHNFPIPKVDPVFVTLDKILLDVNGAEVNSTKPFVIKVDGQTYTITPNDAPLVIRKVWNVGSHTVTEDPTTPPYITTFTVNGVSTNQINMAQGGADQNVIIRNKENAAPVTATKVWNGGPTPKPAVWFKLYRQIGTGTAVPVPGVNPMQVPATAPFTVTWPNLPITNIDGDTYIYSVREGTYAGGTFTEGVPTGYEIVAGQDPLTITNRYVISKINVKATKVWANGPISDQEVSLQLLRNGTPHGAPVMTVNRTYTWTGLDATDTDGVAYVYTVAEPTVPANYQATVTGNQKDGFTITNRYTSPKINVKATKVWVNGTSTRPTVYFKLYRHVEGGTPVAVPAAELKMLPHGTLTVTWTGLDKTDNNGNPYIFTVREVNESGNDYTPPAYTKVENGLTVTNTYQASGSFKPSVSKALAGRDLKAGEFNFSLLLGDAMLQTKSNLANGNVLFDAITYTQDDIGKTFTYLVREIAGTERGMTYDGMTVTITVVVTDAGNGELDIDVTYSDDTTFNNSYKASGRFKPSVSKALAGRDLKAGEFKFKLLRGDTVLQTKSNLANGNVLFDAITYTQDDIGKTFTYLVREIAGTETGMTYDGMTVTITVVVTDAGNGELDIDVTYSEDTTFNNSYEASGSWIPAISKELSGRELTAGEFNFSLLLGDATLQTKSNLANGNVLFDAIHYTQEDIGKTFTYLVREVAGTETGMAYDGMTVTITVVVTDARNGELDIDVTYSADTTFNNSYEASGNWIPAASKELSGRDLAAGEFNFRLMLDDATLQTKSNLANGNVLFDAIHYTQEDIGKTFTYLVREVAGTETGIAYDGMTVTITVVVTDARNGELDIDVTYSADTTFNNSYEASGNWIPAVSKELSGRDLTAGEFNFRLMLDDATLQTKSNLANGNVLFDAIHYTQEDIGKTFTYLVRENTGTELGMDYDGMTVTISVVVTDARNGELDIDVTYSADTTFNNSYEASGNWIPAVSKELSGRELTAGEFEFRLLLGDATLQTKSNLANGNVLFDALHYTQDDIGKTFTYLVREIAGTETGMDYDGMTVTITVVVTDAGNGELDIDVTYSADTTFNNSYEASGNWIPAVSKELSGRELTAGEFEFRLLLGDATLQTKSNFANGNVLFDAIHYTQADIGKTFTYLVREIAGTELGMDYDGMTVTITVVVTDAGDGELDIDVTYSADTTFNNSYEASGSWIPAISKELSGRDLTAGEFNFRLMLNDVRLQTKSNLANGNVFFDTIHYTQEDIGKIFTYLVREIAGTELGMDYDGMTVTITVVVTDAGNGELDIDVTYSADTTFNNSFVPQIASLELVKSTLRVTDAEGNLRPGNQFTAVGDLVYYSFEITNTGNQPITALQLQDNKLGLNVTIDLSSNPLMPGESYIYNHDGAYAITADDLDAETLVNVATVTGTTPIGPTDPDTDDNVTPGRKPEEIRRITAVKQTDRVTDRNGNVRPTNLFLALGDQIFYSFTVTNTGNQPITSIRIVDDKLGLNLEIDLGDTPLLPGESYTYRHPIPYIVVAADLTAERVVNTATVTGITPNGPTDPVPVTSTTPGRRPVIEVPRTGEYPSTGPLGGALLLAAGVLLLIQKRRRRAG